jgi:hypothetical protein
MIIFQPPPKVKNGATKTAKVETKVDPIVLLKIVDHYVKTRYGVLPKLSPKYEN